MNRELVALLLIGLWGLATFGPAAAAAARRAADRLTPAPNPGKPAPLEPRCAGRFHRCADAVRLLRELGLDKLAEEVRTTALPEILAVDSEDDPRSPPPTVKLAA